MKRFLALLLASLLLLALMPAALAADVPSPIPVIPKEEIRPTPKGLHHFMLICMDSWAADLNREGHHTDGLILVTVDDYARRVMLTSFIRDMLIQRPDGAFGRINNILEWTLKQGKSGEEGIQNLIDVINTHFDLRIEKFIVVDFQQVENIIDAIGGVDITITAREANYLTNYAISRSSTTPAISGAGTYHFSGHAAVIYMRCRKVHTAEYLHADGKVYYDTQDVGRTYRDRLVLSSIADSLKDITYEDALRLLDVVISNTKYTNMSSDDLLSAVDLAMDVKGTPVEHIRMPIDGSYEPMPVAGMATQQLDFPANREALWSFLLNSFVVVDDE